MELRTIFLWYQVSLDTTAALASLYMGIAITQEFGLGSRQEIWQLMHRVAFALVTAAWAWHAEDLIMHSELHGLTFTNIFLHTTVLMCMIIASVRIWRFQRNQVDNRFMNGGLMTGPFR